MRHAARGSANVAVPTWTADAPASTKRYAYQFYVAPDNEALGALIRDLPPDKRVMWQNRNRLAPRSS